jgi:cytochrome c oxidase subunit 2
MGSIATTIAVFYTVVSVIAIAFIVMVVRSTLGRGPERTPDIEKIRHTEKKWFVAVVIALAALVCGTIFYTPYGRTANANAQVIKIEGMQFAWLIPPVTIKAGHQVEFELTSKDVNHSFAVYNASGELLFQVQVMPGHWQDYVYTFKKAGTYKVLCLEYCGVGHDEMRAQLTVTA